jgi:hypothetical protein
MGKTPESDNQYSQKEAAERFRAALKGARVAGHVPMKAKKAAKKTKAKKKATRKA